MKRLVFLLSLVIVIVAGRDAGAQQEPRGTDVQPAAAAGQQPKLFPEQAVVPQGQPTGVEFAPPNEVEQHLIRVLRTTNKAQTNRYVPKVYDFKNVNPYDVLRFIRRSMEIEEGAWFIFGKPEDPADRESVKSGKVVLMAPLYQLPYLDNLMKIIDRPGLTTSAGDKMLYYRPKHRNVADPSFIAAANAAMSPNKSASNQVPDTEVNGFLFYDSPSGIAGVQAWLPAIDQPPPQVMVEATLYEINVENDDAVGLDLVAWKNGPGRKLFKAGAFWEKERIPTLKGGSPLLNTGVPGGTFALPGHGWEASGTFYSYFLDLPSAFFDFLVAKQKARVLASAKILTRNGRAAQLKAGDFIFFWLRNEDAASQRIVVGDQREHVLGASSVGTFLSVTPLIGTDGINLAVNMDLVDHTGFDSIGTPQLVRRNYNTNVRVQDGQEIVLGGYNREMMVQESTKVPFLGSIPIIGYLFGSEQNLVKKRQVVVVLTANIVNDFSAMTGAGSQIDAALIKARASRQVPVKNLDTEAGFDQWLLDTEGEK
jgi:type II secretory pathway component GspD/PulD (secretin)